MLQRLPHGYPSPHGACLLCRDPDTCRCPFINVFAHVCCQLATCMLRYCVHLSIRHMHAPVLCGSFTWLHACSSVVWIIQLATRMLQYCVNHPSAHLADCSMAMAAFFMHVQLNAGAFALPGTQPSLPDLCLLHTLCFLQSMLWA